MSEEQKKKRREYIAERRKSAEYREKERIVGAERQKKRREKMSEELKKRREKMSEELKKKRREYIAEKRKSAEYREKERLANAERLQKRRSIAELRTPEKCKDAEAHRNRRSIPELRTPEKCKDADSHRLRRSIPELRTPEKCKDAEAHRLRRSIPELRTPEKCKDAEAQRNRRSIPELRSPEKCKDAEAHRLRRSIPEQRGAEQEKNTEAHKNTRSNPLKRSLQQESNTLLQQKKRKIERSSYEKLLETYLKEIKQIPTYVCSCCGGLWYNSSTTGVTKEGLKETWQKKYARQVTEPHVLSEESDMGEEENNHEVNYQSMTDEFLSFVFCVNQQEHRLCCTCKRYITSKNPKVPSLCLNNGFQFPEIPSQLKDLSSLEERLVALRLPFMQIRALGSERQSQLRGNVVNVQNDLEVTVNVIPRRIEETGTVQVKLKRRMADKSPYMYEVVRPAVVDRAAKCLEQTELYKKHEIKLSDRWGKFGPDDTIRLICNQEENNINNEMDGAANQDIVNEADGCLANTNAQGDPDVFVTGADESLIFDDSDISSMGIMIAPGEGKKPIPFYEDINAEELSFPTIYCGQSRKFNENVKKSYTFVARSEIRRYDRRACQPTHLLYAFKKSYNEKVRQAIQIYFRKSSSSEKVHARDVRNPGYIEDLIRQDLGDAVFKNLRSTPSYWQQKSKMVRAMVRQTGKCAFFITLSAAETKWNELLVGLMKLLKNQDISEAEAAALSFEEKSELIRSDPVTCMRNFDHRYRSFLNKLLRPQEGLFSPYQLEDYFNRLEFQMRGSPHSHALYWLKGAPQYVEGDEASENACIEFIDKFITCERCEEGKMKDLIGYQIHKDTHTCRKKRIAGNIECRFGFPKPPLKKTMILAPLPAEMSSTEKKNYKELFTKIQEHLRTRGRHPIDNPDFESFLEELGIIHDDYILGIRSSIKRCSVFLKRKVNESYVNGYNRQILEAWGANIDIQFVLDTYACAKYCVGYILKAEGGVSKLLQAATQNVQAGNLTIRDKMKAFARVLITGTEISAQEAAAFLLGMDYTHCSRQSVFVNTSPPEERTHILKTQQELELIDDESEDIYAKGLIDYYTQRSEDLETVCLANYATLYEYSKTKPYNKNKSNHFTFLNVSKNTNVKFLKFHGIDNTGEICFTAFSGIAEKLAVIIKPNCIYTLENFKVNREDPMYPSGTGCEWKIDLTDSSIVTAVPDDQTLTEIPFSFVTLKELEGLESNSKIDVLGILTDKEPLQKTTFDNWMLKLDISDRTKLTCVVCLYKSSAQEFANEPFCPIAFRKLTLKERCGTKTLEEGTDTLIWVNPEIGEATKLMQWFEEEKTLNPPLADD